MTAQGSVRNIRMCADDYGISPGVNRGIRELIARGRLNATSVMVVGPAIGGEEIDALAAAIEQNPHCTVGLHTTLTAPFHPLTLAFRPLSGGLFPPLSVMLRKSLLRRLDVEIIGSEISAQIAAFAALLGRPPDYFDGHQHVQLFPQVRDALLNVVKSAAPNAWVRQCGRIGPWLERMRTPKALLLDTLSARLRGRAARARVAVNPGFAGAYDFTRETDFGALMRGFLDELPPDGVVMCHPGHVDDVLIAVDPLTDQREREYDFLASDEFLALLAAKGVALA